jgi:hypothetical protein
MEEKPMLNSPVELQSDAADKFAKEVISRLNASHDARKALNSMLADVVKRDLESIECDKQRFTAMLSILNRKTFGAAG